MNQEKHSDTKNQEYIHRDITLDLEWTSQNTDRLISWEILRRGLFNRTEEIPAEKLCDMIGVPYTYIFSIIKQARKYAKR